MPVKTAYTFRVQWDLEADARAREAGHIHDWGESLTQQHHGEDADINALIKRFGLGNVAIPPAAHDPAYYGDFSEAPGSLSEALNTIADAQDKFDALPPDLRFKFNNDPRQLWSWVHDIHNVDEAVQLGLLAPYKEEIKTEIKKDPE